MFLLAFTLRHLRRHWRMNLAVLLGLTLAAALLAGLPGYATAIAARSLDQALADAPPAGRNLQVTAAIGLGAGLYGRIKDSLGELIQERHQVREIQLAADDLPVTATVAPDKTPPQTLRLWSFDKLAHNVRVVEGRLPVAPDPRAATDPLQLPPMEAAIGSRAASRTGWGVGDRVTASKETFRFDIVGIVEPLEPEADLWWGDLIPFDILINTDNINKDSVTLSLLVHPNTMRNYQPAHEVSWRILLDGGQITVDNAQAVESKLIGLETRLGKNRAQVDTNLTQILAHYRSQLSRVRMALLLLSAQAFIFVLYTLAMLTSFLLDRSEVELATLVGRGATALQITWVFALESLILALLAASLLGPSLAQGTLRLWAAITGASIPAALPRESWLLAGGATALGWLALVLPVYPAARRNLLEWQHARARPARRSTLQKLYLDLFLLALGGLLYWQLNESGSFVARRLRATSLADPLLLLGPTLLLIAVAMLFLRLFPYLLRLTAWGLRQARGLMLPLGLSRLARDPLKPSRVVLLISLTAGLVLFTRTFDDSLTHSQREMAHYLAGADLRISRDSTDQSAGLSLSQLTDLPGILAVSPVLRTQIATEEGKGVQLIAVDPETFGQVARYPPDLTHLTIPTVLNVVEQPLIEGALPVIFSADALPNDKNIGDELLLALHAGNRFSVRVQGTINNFPAASGRFVLISLPSLENHVDLDTAGVRASSVQEAWLRVDPDQHAALVDHPALAGRTLDDAQDRLHALQADALAQGTTGAFQLNALTLALLSGAGFLLVHFFAAQRRVLEFSVLRAMGLSARQLLSLLVTEGALVMTLGLLAGTAIGYALAHLMVPFLSGALSASLAGVSITQVLTDWPAIVRLYLLLIGFYALAMLLLLLALTRVGLHRALRMGDE